VAWITYRQLERLWPRAWVAAACRAVAWTALGVLLLDLTCPRPGVDAGRPLVLLDGSLSMQASGGQWQAALDSARAWGEVRLFGDPGSGTDTLPTAGRSALAPALRAAAASDRPVLVVSDGEVDDLAELTPELLARAGVRLFPRAEGPDLAVVRVEGPDRVTAGDTIALAAEVRAFGRVTDSARVEVRLDERVLGRQAFRPGADGTQLVRFRIPSAGLPERALLSVALRAAGDREPRDDARLWLVHVAPAPGVVLLASPADWDARFLYQTLRDVASLPVRGYVRLDRRGGWRSMDDLSAVSDDDVARAARRADVLVEKGAMPAFVREARPRGRLVWPSGEMGQLPVAGEWYAAEPPSSPVAAAFVGLPVDSFPPLIEIAPVEPAREEWVGLTVRLGRRGAERPVLLGGAEGNRRRVFVAGEGLWRWAFRGGSAEQAYRSLMAGTLTWLLGGADSASGRARPVRPVVPNGRPLIFAWSGQGRPEPEAITISGSADRRDTLRFDGGGHAELRLPPGRYRYRLDGGGDGMVVVDPWSEEWLPRSVVLEERPVPAVTSAGATNARNWVWLFLLAVLALGGEWIARRRLGLR
jgi:hypothetical protein